MGGPMRFLRDRRNREVLGWLGSGLVVLAGAAWAVFTYVRPPPATIPLRADTAANASLATAPAELNAANQVRAQGPDRATEPAATEMTASDGGVIIAGNATNTNINTGR